MKTLIKVTAVVFGLMPLSVSAQDWTPSEDDLDALRYVLAEVGCVVTDEVAALAVEEATDYSETELEVMVEQLRIYQEIIDASEDGGIKLVTGACAS